eukprot:2319829-Pyramimonas_sp.AAC.1
MQNLGPTRAGQPGRVAQAINSRCRVTNARSNAFHRGQRRGRAVCEVGFARRSQRAGHLRRPRIPGKDWAPVGGLRR